jgi:hypothetical protein
MTFPDMIISSEQALLALRILALDEYGGLSVRHAGSGSPVPPELLHRVNRVLSELPETRVDRVEKARADIAGGGYDSDEVADKIIARAISDTLR